MYRQGSIELQLDKRLSFKDNFALFKDRKDVTEFKDKQIMAKKGSYALKMDVPISTFNLKSFTRLYIY